MKEDLGNLLTSFDLPYLIIHRITLFKVQQFLKDQRHIQWSQYGSTIVLSYWIEKAACIFIDRKIQKLPDTKFASFLIEMFDQDQSVMIKSLLFPTHQSNYPFEMSSIYDSFLQYLSRYLLGWFLKDLIIDMADLADITIR